jgi:hypothetical protein
MKLVKSILLNSGGQKDLFAPSVDIEKPGIFQVESFSIARIVACKQV